MSKKVLTVIIILGVAAIIFLISTFGRQSINQANEDKILEESLKSLAQESQKAGTGPGSTVPVMPGNNAP